MILVPMSGGVESAAVAHHALSLTTEGVIGLYVRFGDAHENMRRTTEDIAVQQVARQLVTLNRPFKMVSVDLPFRTGPHISDILPVYYAASHVIAEEPRIYKVMRGVSAIDWGYRDYAIRRQRTEEWVRMVCGEHIQFLAPFDDTLKGDVLKTMPHELIQATWSCRKPVITAWNYAKPCGTCHACVGRKEAMNHASMTDYKHYPMNPRKGENHDAPYLSNGSTNRIGRTGICEWVPTALSIPDPESLVRTS